MDITSIPARTWSATRTSEAQIGRDLAVDEEPEDSSRPRHRPRGAERRPAFGSFEEVSSGTVVSARPELHPIRWRLARLAIDRASRKRDMAASMWLVRCGCRRRSKDRGTGAGGTRLEYPKDVLKHFKNFMDRANHTFSVFRFMMLVLTVPSIAAQNGLTESRNVNVIAR